MFIYANDALFNYMHTFLEYTFGIKPDSKDSFP